MTHEEREAGLQKILDRFKRDPNYELNQELGTMLMRHINSYTPEERKRYDELITQLKRTPDH